MIPLELSLKNFLSYREATLNFRGLHTACICGANGAGKSSLLEAITWVIWGKSRAVVDDDVIYTGCNYVRVDFQFISNQEVYRIIRNRHRGRSSHLEFQIESSGEFRSLTSKGIRATQEKIVFSLKLDYETFINSAYLRQGRADEFMLRRPIERKQILADLLKLGQYQELSNRAKDLSKQYQGQAQHIELSLVPIKEKLEKKKDIQGQQLTLSERIQKLQLNQEKQKNQLQQLQREEQQRKTWYNQLDWQEQQYKKLEKDKQRLQKEKNEINQQLHRLIIITNQEDNILKGCQKLLELQKEEKSLSLKFKVHQDNTKRQQLLTQKLNKKHNVIELQIHQAKTQLDILEREEKELQYILKNSDEVKTALQHLSNHRRHLYELDKLQHKVTPIQQKYYNIHSEIEQVKANLKAQLEQLYIAETDCLEQLEKMPKIRESVSDLDTKIQNLDNKKNYQKRVEEKGQKQKEYQKILKENQRHFEEKIEELKQKLQKLNVPNSICPLCEQPLNDTHLNQIFRKTQLQEQEIKDKIWMLQEQISLVEKELKILRIEYTQLNKDLADYPSLQKKIGQLEAQLETFEKVNFKLKQVREKIQKIEQKLTENSYCIDLQSELNTLNQELKHLNYDEQTHALVRGEVERLRKVEIRQAKLEDANRRQSIISQQKPQLIQKISALKQEIKNLHQTSKIKQELEEIEQSIQNLGYQNSNHQELLKSLRESQSWELKFQELQQAKQQYPELQKRLEIVEIRLNDNLTEQNKIKQEIDILSFKIKSTMDQREIITVLEKSIQIQRQKLDELLANQGRLEQSISQLESVKQQFTDDKKQLKDIYRKYRVYTELAQAFGKNGIQALMIENILPQLEAETNQILARLTDNQLHIQFFTQRKGRSGSSRKKTTKVIDTLDILISDSQGTRSYETYSGGEAFRINFSIRLALAKLLAQQAGTSLQMLIVDEGFGTQDAQGCEQLVAAINAIASDFSCILSVTHMPRFKEAFQCRIEVYKDNQGSQLELVS
ncbi:exonuclease subunit SbcC [cyanobacterium endosymbiont of Epithemia clementina EcSB]|uniref:exonuclease subunit SbcC n=1 Tax=cyanobacterium endosymbiont of Epithemia clementina EcSB TaxID=3034674 RepID=UPI00247FA388|nr:exonuclease subunit SbcC [cyanobacterium endosymbiont of Epithemia clementina EcSB]WGT67451.1 exonuclease subunit SbcC [cyanobacterium endosymbiont of Epithemia clementina EcSB]